MSSILEEAARITSGDRCRDYGHPLANHERIADLWRSYLRGKYNQEFPVTAEDAVWMMLLVKVAREMHSPKADNRVDIAGYAHCAQQIDDARRDRACQLNQPGDVSGDPEAPGHQVDTSDR
tara:strand:+ start:132 stop:494 length:363 start_codon:yes stop_codon:yes gene_type:complete